MTTTTRRRMLLAGGSLLGPSPARDSAAIDYARREQRHDWLHHPTLGEASFDAFVHQERPIVEGAPPLEWPVNPFLFVDPVSRDWYGYIGCYPTGYAVKLPPAQTQVVAWRSRDRGTTWERLGPMLPARFRLAGLAGVVTHAPDVTVVYDGGRYHMAFDFATEAFKWESAFAPSGENDSTIISVNNCPVCSILMAWASEEQKQRYLVPLARGDMLGAFCLTEPHVGSDAGGLRTTATRDGDDYLLNRVKRFITSGKNGDVAIVMAVTDKAAGKKGISAFLVPTSTPGYTVARIEDKMGQHSSDTAQILFEDCRVPAENRLGEEGMGLRIALSGLEGGRIGIASQSVGMVRAGLRRGAGLQQGAHRLRHGDFNHQAVQFKLAEMAMKIEAARQLIWHAAVLKDAGRPCLKEAAMAKLNASEMAEAVCSAAIPYQGCVVTG